MECYVYYNMYMFISKYMYLIQHVLLYVDTVLGTAYPRLFL